LGLAILLPFIQQPMIASQDREFEAYRSLNHIMSRVERILRSQTEKDDPG
jgi:hypothetical protein